MAKRMFSAEEKYGDDLSIYSHDASEWTLEDEELQDDEISPSEEAFMNSYEEEFV